MLWFPKPICQMLYSPRQPENGRWHLKGERMVRYCSCKTLSTGWLILLTKPAKLLLGGCGWLIKCSRRRIFFRNFFFLVSWSLRLEFRRSMIHWIWGWVCASCHLRSTKSPLIYMGINYEELQCGSSPSVERSISQVCRELATIKVEVFYGSLNLSREARQLQPRSCSNDHCSA